MSQLNVDDIYNNAGTGGSGCVILSYPDGS